MEFTFNGIKTEMKTRLSLLSNWRTTLYFGVYERILDVIAYILDKFTYIAEYLYREANWKTAQNRESLMYKCDFLSYKPYRKIGAYGNLTLSADSTFNEAYTYTGESVIINKWDKFTNIDRDIFVYCRATTIYYKNTIGNIKIPVREGEPQEFLYTAIGEQNEIISLYSDSIDNEEIEIFIVDSDNNVLAEVNICGEGDNPTELYFVDDLINYYCEVYNAYDFQSVNIKFGDGISSRALATGEFVLIKYAETKGSDGNIQNTGVIVSIDTELEDSLGNSVTLFVTNEEEISDGSDIEDIESIRHNGRNLFSTGYRAGSQADWEAIIEANTAVYKAIVWSKTDLGLVVTDEDQSKIYITAISNDGTELTSAQQDDITLNYLKDIKSPTDIIVWQTLNKIYAAFRVVGRINNQPFDVVGAQIQDVLDDNYNILKTDFKVNIYESNFINIIDDIDEILYHETEIYHLEKDFDVNTVDYTILVSNTSLDENDLEKQIYIIEDSCEIWIKRKISGVWQDPIQIGQDSAGVITGVNGYTIENGAVNYLQNTVTFTVRTIIDDPVTYGIQTPGESDPNGYIISIIYKTKDGNGNQQNSLRLPQFDFITDIDKDYITYTLSYA